MIPIFIDVKDNISQLISLIIFSMIFFLVGFLFELMFGGFKWLSRKSLKEICCNKEKIIIEQEKKGLFSTKKITNEIIIDNIIKLRREEFQKKLNSITITFNNDDEEFLIAEEFYNLEKLYKFIIKQRDFGKNIKITKLDIDTLEEIEV